MIPGIVASSVQVGSGAFNPWDAAYPTPLHAGWAGDPAWSNPGNGNGVASWRNQSGGGDPAQATGTAQPLYRSATASYNNRPTVEFVSSDYLAVNITDVAQPYKLLIVGNIGGNDQRIFGTDTSGGGSRGVGSSGGGAWAMVASSAITGGTRNSNPHTFHAHFNGASSALLVDGVSVAAGNVGTISIGGKVWLGCDMQPARFLVGHIAYWGVYSGAADLTTLDADLRSHYGI